MKYPCSSTNHHLDCDGYVDTEGVAYSCKEINGKEYYWRYMCTLKERAELYPITPSAALWLKKTLKSTFDLDRDDYAREIYLTLD